VREILGYRIPERTHNVLATRAEADLFATVSDLNDVGVVGMHRLVS